MEIKKIEPEDGVVNSNIDKILENVNICSESIFKCQKYGDKLLKQTSLTENDYRAYLNNLKGLTSKLLRAINAIEAQLPERKDEPKLFDAEPIMKIQKNNELYHFILETLLPHRPTFDKNKKEYRYQYESDLLVNRLRSSIKAYINHYGRPKMFDEITVLFIHHFGNGNMIDLDNIKVKEFIDVAINKFLVIDDNPTQVSIVMIGEKKEGKRYTEVYAGKRADIEKIWRKINNKYNK